MSHEQFEAEPVHAVRWMLEIHQLKKAVDRERRHQQRTEGLM